MLGYHTQHKYQIPRANKWKCLNQEWVTSSGVWISLLSIAKINKYNNQKQLREEMICLVYISDHIPSLMQASQEFKLEQW